MKYAPPQNLPYESALTAQSLYNIVNKLIRERIVREGSQKLKKNSLGLGKLWDETVIRSELEEFLDSFCFTNLQETLPGFKYILKDMGRATRNQKLIDYIKRLEQEYGSREVAYEEISSLLRELKKRGYRFLKETTKINNLQGLALIKRNAVDAFRHILTPIYGRIELFIEELVIK